MAALPALGSSATRELLATIGRGGLESQRGVAAPTVAGSLIDRALGPSARSAGGTRRRCRKAQHIPLERCHTFTAASTSSLSIANQPSGWAAQYRPSTASPRPSAPGRRGSPARAQRPARPPRRRRSVPPTARPRPLCRCRVAPRRRLLTEMHTTTTFVVSTRTGRIEHRQTVLVCTLSRDTRDSGRPGRPGARETNSGRARR